MARIDTLKNFLTDIADKFRAKLGTTELINHADYDVKIDEVYDKGTEDGREALWDILFNNEIRKGNFPYAFYRWKEFDFGTRLDGIKYKNVFWMFAQSGVKSLDIVFDLSEITANINNMFYSCSDLEYVKKIIFSDQGNLPTMTQMFYAAPKLKEIRFEGVIDNSINIVASTLLSKYSIRGSLATEEEIANGKNLFTSEIDGNTYYGGLITALSTTKGATLTISKTAVTNAFGSTDSDEWKELISGKCNTQGGPWTISLK